ncbi:AAA family ATPase [Bradyrhizobium diazoefficiens]|uniref:Toprim domain-containing protein n=1 Tax=Bradyrhizobium diazoefficiens TaxID=1355477 RepID=A0A809Z8S9_9BRAD|nr:hypothetical protein XF1B_51860 [Bradyrhizobium diazoefficiens]BCE48769.1 hypothetical protein XF4B_51180 [Bradyrhizobium diazoefficiens]BCE92284.1 hypothetical protein XF10B_50820 [Bradyrhizobium diazoefficiens]BCF27212.1 hypothetical protein XF14B_51640 [Bradyrhizobium diazoefficiens]
MTPQQVAAALGGEVSGREVLAPGPGHAPKDRSLSIKLDSSAPDGMLVHSFAGDDPLQCKDYVRERLGLGRWEPKRSGSRDHIGAMNARALLSKSKPAAYVYHREDGQPYLRVNRTASKGFWQEHWTGTEWLKGGPKGPDLPYRLPEILENASAPVLIVEGEKDADNLASLGFVATTNPKGAGNFSPDLVQHFRDRDVYILPDNDEAGAKHAGKVSELLAGVARSIHLVDLPALPVKGDVSDWLAAGNTADDLKEILNQATASPKLSSPARGIRLIPFNEIKLSTGGRDLIKGLIPRSALTVVWGKPKCGKSFWLYDCLMHVALNWEYRGRRVHHGPVVYCAFEGQRGLEGRIEAFRLKHLEAHEGDVPFYLQPVTLDLVKDREALIRVIRDRLGDVPPVVVALDTLNRSLAGSESSDEDMSAYIQASDAIREAFDCSIVIVHHCGHDDSRMRGHSSLFGALDAEIAVTRASDNSIIAEVRHSKDGPEGEQEISALEVVSVGVDDDGDEITSCVVVPADGVASERSQKWPRGLRLVREVITEALVDSGTNHHVGGDGPLVRATTVQAAREHHRKRYVSTGEGDREAAERKAWSRNLKGAREGSLIGAEFHNGQELVWLLD